MIHHSHVTREIHGYVHNFCNKKVRELTETSGQYFSCVFHNGFRFDMTFLTKWIWLFLWQTRDVSLLGSGLTTLKSYIIGRQVKFIDSVKYYQQPPSKLARSTTSEEKIRIKFFLQDLSEDDRNYVLQLCFPYESVTGFYSRLRDEGIS